MFSAQNVVLIIILIVPVIWFFRNYKEAVNKPNTAVDTVKFKWLKEYKEEFENSWRKILIGIVIVIFLLVLSYKAGWLSEIKAGLLNEPTNKAQKSEEAGKNQATNK